MGAAKQVLLKPISKADADACIRRHHYSGRTVKNSQLHIGVYWNGLLEGAMQFGPPMDKRKLIRLVAGTGWSGFIELNRMAFSEALPRNSESRALSIAMRLLRQHAPHLKWVVSFADGVQCGDGTIYRAAGFVLTGVSSGSLVELPDDLARLNGGRVAHRLKLQDKSSFLSREILRRTGGKNLTNEEHCRRFGGRVLKGYMFRYVYFLDPTARERLTVPILPFRTIDEIHGRMIRGASIDDDARLPDGEGGLNPTAPLSSL